MNDDRKPFEPADGLRPRWQYCYDLVVERNINDEITRREVMDMLACDWATAGAAMGQAKVHLEEDGRLSVRTVPKFGWVVMRAGEHLAEADREARSGHRKLKAGYRKLSAIDHRRGELSQFEREAVDRRKAWLSQLVDSSRRPSLTELHKRAAGQIDK